MRIYQSNGNGTVRTIVYLTTVTMMIMMIPQHHHNDHDREWQAQEQSGGNCKYLRSTGSARPYLALSHQPPVSFDHDDDDGDYILCILY